MNPRNEGLTEEFTLWLNRYSPRNTLRADPQALAAEINALMRVLLKTAPTVGYLEWLQKVTDALDAQMQTAAWPTVSEVGKVAMGVNKGRTRSGSSSGAAWSLHPPTINARRMNAGEQVGEDCLYGRCCVEMMVTGEVSRDLLRKRRSEWYFSLKAFYGEEIARRMEADAVKRHDDAEALFTGPVPQMPSDPIKRMPQGEWDAA